MKMLFEGNGGRKVVGNQEAGTRASRRRWEAVADRDPEEEPNGFRSPGIQGCQIP